MQHWNPTDEAPIAVEPPQDVWAAWLNRPPLHDVTPPPRVPRHWTGIAVALGLSGFWMGLIALAWSLLS